MNKKEMRALIRTLKSQHTAEQLAEMSADVCRSIESDGLWLSAGTVLLYYPLADEVDVRPLIQKAARQGKRVLLPVVVGFDLELRVYDGEGAMTPGAYGILEPTGAAFTDYDSIDLAVIPGMAFDIHGHRLGRGRGYYDRFLPRLTRAYRIGVCFPFQKQDVVPVDENDICMNEVV